jgi:hypothetical protein
MLASMTQYDNTHRIHDQQKQRPSCDDRIAPVHKRVVGDIMWSHFGILSPLDHDSEDQDKIVVSIKNIEAALRAAFNAGLDRSHDEKFSS